jgi:hypothetical protein
LVVAVLLALAFWPLVAVADEPAMPGRLAVRVQASAVGGDDEAQPKVQIWINGQPIELKGGGRVELRVDTDGKAAPGPVVHRWMKLVPPQWVKPKLGEWWLGVMVVSPSDEQRQELKLPAEGGLLVEHVVPDSPAAKAGIQKGDVLIRAGEKELKTVQDLIDIVNQTKDGKLELELRREGKPEKLTVTPAKRPDEAQLPPGDDWRQIEEWLQKWWGPDAEEGKVIPFGRWWKGQFVGPGMILRGKHPLHRPLPKDISITISKTGNELAKITVRQGDQKWEVTEDQLDKLPKDVRGHVEGMLRGSAWGMGMEQIGPLEIPRPLPPQEPFRIRVHRDATGKQPDAKTPEKRLEEMGRQIDELKRQLDELRGKMPSAPAAPPTEKPGKDQPEKASAIPEPQSQPLPM